VNNLNLKKIILLDISNKFYNKMNLFVNNLIKFIKVTKRKLKWYCLSMIQ